MKFVRLSHRQHKERGFGHCASRCGVRVRVGVLAVIQVDLRAGAGPYTCDPGAEDSRHGT